MKNYHGYLVSKKGDVISKHGRKMKPRINKGYHYVGMWINKKKKMEKIHRLVAILFIDNPCNKPFVNHINGIKTDNKIENLEWVTAKENTNHAIMNGLFNVFGENNNMCKLCLSDVNNIRKLYNTGSFTQKEIALTYKVNESTIGKIIRNELWKNINI